MSKDDRRISDDRIKEKCFRYFRGESTYEDEVSIRESLSDGKLSMDDFRTMEKDWCDSERPTAGQRMAYGENQGTPVETLAAEDFRPGGSGGGCHRGVVLQSVQ